MSIHRTMNDEDVEHTRVLVKKKDQILGRLTGWVGRACDSRSLVHEFKPHAGCRAYLKNEQNKINASNNNEGSDLAMCDDMDGARVFR